MGKIKCHNCGSTNVTHCVALGSKYPYLGKFADIKYIEKHDGLTPECYECEQDRNFISRHMQYSPSIIRDDIKGAERAIRLLKTVLKRMKHE